MAVSEYLKKVMYRCIVLDCAIAGVANPMASADATTSECIFISSSHDFPHPPPQEVELRGTCSVRIGIDQK
jgi:hypothetical protein